MKMLELADGELELETMGLLMGKLMKNTLNIIIQCDDNNYLVTTFYQVPQKTTKIQTIYWPKMLIYLRIRSNLSLPCWKTGLCFIDPKRKGRRRVCHCYVTVKLFDTLSLSVTHTTVHSLKVKFCAQLFENEKNIIRFLLPTTIWEKNYFYDHSA